MKYGTQGFALEVHVEVKAVSQGPCKGFGTHAPVPEALQNAAVVSQISIMGTKKVFARISIKDAK